MSITVLEDGWVEYGFYFGNGTYPSYANYRYNEANQMLRIRREHELAVRFNPNNKSVSIDGSLLIKLEPGMIDSSIFVSRLYTDDDSYSNPYAFQFWWENIEKNAETERAWAFFMREKAKEEKEQERIGAHAAKSTQAPPA